MFNLHIIKKRQANKNNMKSKLKRTFTAVLPVSKNRIGTCKNCGHCCLLPLKCPFLVSLKAHRFCAIYPVRPLNCRKYPRTEKECLTGETCGFHFAHSKNYYLKNDISN